MFSQYSLYIEICLSDALYNSLLSLIPYSWVYDVLPPATDVLSFCTLFLSVRERV